MDKIQMVDLINQTKHLKRELDLAIEEVIVNSNFINGPQVKRFESSLASFIDAKHCISCANGTDALQIAMMALNLQPGDEIIIPAFNYIATIEAASLLQLKPVIVDVDPNTFNIDTEKISETISSKTKAIIPVHLFGQCADMNKILNLAKSNNLKIIEDAAQSLGSKYKIDNNQISAGTIGNVGITSFFPSKILGCFGDGGAIFTNDADLALNIRKICNHGQEKKYHHDTIGVNSRLDSIQASVLNVKINYLNNYIDRRQIAANYYDNAFFQNSRIETPFRDLDSNHVFHQYTIKVPSAQRDALQVYLYNKGIPTMIYYPIPIHLQNAYINLGYKKGDFPVSEELCKSVISLPMHTELNDTQLKYISENVLSFFKN